MGRASTTVLAALGALMVVASQSAAAPRPGFHPCGRPYGLVCATVVVPLDRSGRVPGVVHLHVEKRPAATQPSRGALFVLTGGPGFGVGAEAKMWIDALAPALATRDLILVDYRGNGRSDRLTCKASATSVYLYREQCAASVGARFFHYSPWDMADDVDAVRAALGVDAIAIVGSSYGTLVAEDYARRFGSHVEWLALDSVESPDGPDVWDRTTIGALPRVLRDICAGRECKGITSDPVRDLAALLARTSPQTFVYLDANGRPVRLRENADQLAIDMLRMYEGDALIYQAVSRARLPGAVASDLAGDPAPLARMLGEYVYWLNGRRAVSGGDYDQVAEEATVCSLMNVPWRGATDWRAQWSRATAALLALPAGQFAPFSRRAVIQNRFLSGCLGWASSPTPPAQGPLQPYRGRVLALEGADDLRTPIENVTAARRWLPHLQLFVVPHVGHGLLGSIACARAAFAAFAAGKRLAPCPGGRPLIPPEPLAPTSYQALQPWRGTSSAAGEITTAVVDTLRDVLYTSYTDGPYVGLRGGTFAVRGATAVCKRIVYVPGIAVSGTLDTERGDATVSVTTPDGGGTLTLSRSGIHGRVAGEPITAAGAELTFRG